MFLSKRRQRRIEQITKTQWDQVSLMRHDKMRGNDAGDVRARAIKWLFISPAWKHPQLRGCFEVADFLEVTIRTVENYLDRFGDELAQNGYEVIRGKRLQALKLGISTAEVPELDFGNLKTSPQLGVFPSR